MYDTNLLKQGMRALFESTDLADGDFCGEQREFHLPRLRTASSAMMSCFPMIAADILEEMAETTAQWHPLFKEKDDG